MISVLAFLLISGLVGGGASVAAESSLPGDLLYPIKVGVNEKVGFALAGSAEAKADFDTKIALRRVIEAEQLSIKGGVSSDVAAQLEANFKAHADRVAVRVAELEADGKLDAALEANSNFQSSLNAHQAILVKLANEDKDTSDRNGLLGLSVRLQNAVSASGIAGANVESKLRLRGSADFQSAAEGKARAAQNKVDEVRSFLDSNEASVSAEVKARAEARLAESNSAIAQGKIKIEAKAYGEAFILFQRAMRLAQEAKMTVSGNVEIRLRLLDVKEDRDSEESDSSRESSGSRTEGSVEVEGNADARSGNSGANASGKVEVKVGF